MDYVFFDFDDTLYDQAQPFAKAYYEVLDGRFGLDPIELFKASRRHSEAVFEASERGEMPMEEMYVYRIQQAFKDLGAHVGAEDCLSMQYAYSHNQEHGISLTPTMERVLDCVCAHARAGVISNGPAEHQLAKLRRVRIERWIADDAVFISSMLGVAKPSPKIFVLACERLGTTPERCAYVGDSFGPDVVGAASAHMPVVWFNRRHREAPDVPVPTWTVHTEQELLELLRDEVLA